MREAPELRDRRVREATYAIARAVSRTEGLGELFRSIHRIVAGLMEAKNFYIALTDRKTGLLTFPYFVDERDPVPPAGPQDVGRGLTAYVLRTARPLLASPEVFERLVADGEVDLVGAPSVDWLGVPLRVGERTIGVLTVQSYSSRVRYTKEDLDLLLFVSAQVALAVDHRRAEEALRQRERELKRRMDAMSDAIAEFGLDGTYRFVSPSYRLAGWEPEKLIGTSGTDLIHPDDVPRVREIMEGVIRDGRPASVQYRYRRADGRYFWSDSVATLLLDESGAPEGLVVSGRDSTRRKRDEAVLALFHETERALLRREPVGRQLQRICEQLLTMFDLEAVFIGKRTGDGAVVPLASTGTDAGRTSLPGTYVAPLAARDRVLGVLEVRTAAATPAKTELQALLHRFADQIALLLVEAEQLERLDLQTAALEAAANAVVITDAEGIIEWVNRAFTELTGYALSEVRGQTPRILKSGVQNPFYYQKLWETVLAGNVWRGELYNRRKDGSVYVEEQTVTPVRGTDGAIRHFVAIKQDVTMRKRNEEQIRHLALHDPLTDLGNRRAVEEVLERAVSRARRGTPSTLLLLDLDHFKVVNDTLGHAAGDTILVEVARLLLSLRRPEDEVARLGGDEFVVVLEGTGTDAGRLVAERIRRAVEAHHFEVEGRRCDLGVSIGVLPIDGRVETGALLGLADAALYAAKEKGRNRIAISDGTCAPLGLLSEASVWASRVKDALREERFVLAFQPIVRLETRTPAHYEALLRMRDGEGGLVLPGVFLPAAERFGLMPQIDAWVFSELLRLLRERPDLEVFMNLSGASLGDESLLQSFEGGLRAAGLGPGRLAIEVTENTAVRDILAAREWMRRLKDLGCRFALDDFGIGFSSFAYLQSLPVDYVKIDGSFLRDLASNAGNRALVKAIETVAETLGKETIAESVESPESVPVLLSLGVEFGQGFALGRPAVGPPPPR